MSILRELQDRFRRALAPLADDAEALLETVRPSQDAKFGDYQANLAMPLGKRLGRPPRQVAAEVVGRLDVADVCLPPEIAGPGFINLRVRDDRLAGLLAAAVQDPRLGVPPVARPRSYVIDYSAPNVAKPMHVGHIRSTVIGDSLWRMLRFLGHEVTSDNHLGDWGTQFGMILYGYKRFCDREAYRQNPVQELARLYRLVRRLMDYHEGKERLPELEAGQRDREADLADKETKGGPKPDKHAQALIRQAANKAQEGRDEIDALKRQAAEVENDEALHRLALADRDVGASVLAETSRLHAGDAENLCLWREFMPHCLDEIDRVYRRLGVRFDETLGESFYHDVLPGVVEELRRREIAVQSEGAVCITRRLKGYSGTTIVQKTDGAFTYATTDLATLRYRMERWKPHAILYVVDHRQKLHFELLFDVARELGYEDVELTHVSFGTVLGDDGRPFKTRSGDTVGLEGLLDEAVRRAHQIVAANDDAKPDGPELPPEERVRIAEIVGIGALKYADLSQNRTSDYVFSYEKMLAMTGNTATYMQYAYARVRSILRKGSVDVEALRASGAPILLGTPAERALGLELLRFGEAIELAVADFRPSQLTGYLFELANCYSTFFENCPVLRAESEALRNSRLLLCDLTARTIRQGLELLGIDVVERM